VITSAGPEVLVRPLKLPRAFRDAASLPLEASKDFFAAS